MTTVALSLWTARAIRASMRRRSIHVPSDPPHFPSTSSARRGAVLEGPGKPGKILRGSGVSNTIFEHHSFSWTLTPETGKK